MIITHDAEEIFHEFCVKCVPHSHFGHCINNDTPSYEPFKPSTFVCQPAGALIITKGGEVEAVSQKCSMAIATFPKFAGTGRTSSLLDEELLLLGDDYLGTKGRYVSIQKPRDGLLAMKYTIHKLPLRHSPHQHSSLVSRNTLTVLGGKFRSRGKLSKFTWTELALKWENGSKYNPSFTSACSVKLGVDVHIIFGGERNVRDQQISGRQVVKINLTEEKAYEMTQMNQSRVFHGCQLLNKSVVLLSGGLPQSQADLSKVLPDELYNLTSQKVVKVLDLQQSLGRVEHALIKLGERVLAIGGLDSNNTAPSKLVEFDRSTNAWNELDQELHSTNTSHVVATPFPVSSLDCVPECRCGIGNRKQRIFGGGEAGVRNTINQFSIESPFLRPILTPGLLHFYGMRTLMLTISTASAALH